MSLKTSYAHGHSAATTASHITRNAENSCAHFLHLVQPSFHVLDVGSGSGTITVSMAAYVPQGKVIGIDTAPEIVQKAAGLPNVPANCSFQTASALSLPFPDASFDVVYTSQVLPHVTDEDVVPILKEMHRVLKPGGFLGCREGDVSICSVYPDIPGARKWVDALLQISIKTKLQVNIAQTIIGLALQAGFEDQKITFSLDSVSHATTTRKYWSDLMVKRVTEDKVFRQKTLELGIVTDEKEFDAMIEGWRQFGDVESAIFIMPCAQIVAFK